MIRANELRIGNWFIGYDNKPFQWTLDYLGYMLQKHNKPDLDELIKSGIPLTEKILLKYGFSKETYEKGHIGIDFKRGSTTMDFVLEEPGFMGEWNKCYTFELPDFRFLNIEYLHQLQNLYFVVTGIEL